MTSTARYIGTKLVSATPMTRGEYNEYRGWRLPADEDGRDAGYLVEYHNGGTPNHPNHAGYISWSPKAQFDNAHVRIIKRVDGLADHQIRVVAEHAQNEQRLTNLRHFTASPAFAKVDPNEQARLLLQADTMAVLSNILNMRIAAFTE